MARRAALMVVLATWCGCTVLFPFGPPPTAECEGCPRRCDEQACAFVCAAVREDAQPPVLSCMAVAGQCRAIDVLHCLNDSATPLTPTALAQDVVDACLNTDGGAFRGCTSCEALAALSDEALEAHLDEDCLHEDTCGDYLGCIADATAP